MKAKAKYLTGIYLFTGLSALTQASLAAEYEGNLDKSFSVSGAGKLGIDADRGSITIKTSGTDTVEARVFRKVKGGAKEKADELFKNHEVTFSQDGNSISIVAKDKSVRHVLSFGGPNLEVRYEITMPKKFDIDLRTSGGDIAVGDLDGQAAARTSSGSIKLAEVSGSVNATDSGGDISIQQAGAVLAHTSSGSITIRKAKGKIEVSDSGGNIEIGEAGADVTGSTSSGSIKISNAGGSVEVKDSGGDINVASASGNVSASTSSGSIVIGKAGGAKINLHDSGGDIEIINAAGAVTAETSSGSIKVKAVKGTLAAKNSGGNIIVGDAEGGVMASTSSGSIKIKSVRGALDLKDSGGDITVEDASGGDALVSTSSGSIHLGRVKGKVEAKDSGGSIIIGEAHDHVMAHTSSGEITVNFSDAPKAESRLEVSGGGVKVSLPRGSGFDIDARSSGGEVHSSIPVAAVTHGGTPHGVLQGKVNGGGAALVLRASSGDIRITENGSLKAEAVK